MRVVTILLLLSSLFLACSCGSPKKGPAMAGPEAAPAIAIPEPPVDGSEEYEPYVIALAREAAVYGENGSAHGSLPQGLRLKIGQASTIVVSGRQVRVMSVYDEKLNKTFYVEAGALALENRPYEEGMRYKVVDGLAWRVIEGRKTLLKGVQVMSDGNWNPVVRWHFEIENDLISKLPGEREGTYWFDWRGDLVKFLPLGTGREIGDSQVSPNGKYVAVDAGTDGDRGMTFYRFSDGSEIASIRYHDSANIATGVLWKGDSVFYTSYPGRKNDSPTSDFHFHSIERLDLPTGTTSTIAAHSQIEEFFLRDLVEDSLVAVRVSVRTPEEWSDLNKYRSEVLLIDPAAK